MYAGSKIPHAKDPQNTTGAVAPALSSTIWNLESPAVPTAGFLGGRAFAQAGVEQSYIRSR